MPCSMQLFCRFVNRSQCQSLKCFVSNKVLGIWVVPHVYFTKDSPCGCLNVKRVFLSVECLLAVTETIWLCFLSLSDQKYKGLFRNSISCVLTTYDCSSQYSSYMQIGTYIDSACRQLSSSYLVHEIHRNGRQYHTIVCWQIFQYCNAVHCLHISQH